MSMSDGSFSASPNQQPGYRYSKKKKMLVTIMVTIMLLTIIMASSYRVILYSYNIIQFHLG